MSNFAGVLFPIFSPLVGMLGSFATGSNVNSNVLFGTLQKTVAILVGASPLVMMGAQTTGGSLGSMIARPSWPLASAPPLNSRTARARCCARPCPSA